MERVPVSSSNLVSVGYNPNENILEIEFTQGRVYQYFDVPESEFEGLMNAQSHGSYFSENIRDLFEYTQIR